MTISFAGDYTRPEWFTGLRLAMRPSKRDMALRLIAVAIAIGAIDLVVAGMIQGEQVKTARLARTALSGAFLLLWAVTPFVRAQWTARRDWKAAGGQPSLKGVVTSEGVMTNAEPQMQPWDSYLKVIRRDDMVILIGNDGLATVLPRRFFDSERAWQNLVQFVEFKVVPPR